MQNMTKIIIIITKIIHTQPNLVKIDLLRSVTWIFRKRLSTLSTSVSKFKSLKRNVIANVKHLIDVCYLIDKEDPLETVNQDILDLINQITPKLSERDDLILRPKN